MQAQAVSGSLKHGDKVTLTFNEHGVVVEDGRAVIALYGSDGRRRREGGEFYVCLKTPPGGGTDGLRAYEETKGRRQHAA